MSSVDEPNPTARCLLAAAAPPEALFAALEERGFEVDRVPIAEISTLPDQIHHPLAVVADPDPITLAEACRTLRQREAVAPFWILAVSATDAAGVALVEAGADDVVTSDSGPELFRVAIAAALRCIDRRRRSYLGLRRLEQLEKALDTMQLGVTVTDHERRIVYTNPADAQMHGYEVAELLGQDARIFAADPALVQTPAQPLIHHERWKREGYNRHRDGSLFPVQITSDVVTDSAGRPTGLVTCCEDITDRRAAEQALKESEERYALAATGANDGLWDWDLRSHEIYFSGRWKAILGFSDPEITKRPQEWLSRIHDADRPQVETALDAHLQGGTTHFEASHRVLHRDGNYRWVLARGFAVRDEQGTPYRIAGSLSDLTGKGVHDHLTGLPNRTFFLDRVANALDRVRRSPEQLFAVLLLDVDRFKRINDSLGHVVGDELLVAVAERLDNSLRASDSLSRLDGTLSRAGGDEFIVLLEGIRGVADAIRVAERILASFEPSFHLHQEEVFATASIGIAVSSERHERPEDLIRDADTAMSRAKARGDARLQVFDEAMHAVALERLQIETELRRGLERDELVAYYQPIVEAATRRVVGFEALVRWNHPRQGLIAPGRFIPVAEESDLILDLDLWMLDTVCRQAHQLAGDGEEPLTVSLNLSGKHFRGDDIVRQVEAALAAAELDPRQLRLEITERVLLSDSRRAQGHLGELRDLGIRLCLDDFGTGYSSLSYMHRFPLDVLKIDRSFVSGLGTGSEARIVETIIELARRLEMLVVAEGVETEAQLAELVRLGCDFAQGFLFAHPMPVESAQELLVGARS